MKVYVVTMHRWGDDETHNYCIGAFSDSEQAGLAGNAEQCWRGGKYEYKISELELNYVCEEKLEYSKKSS